MTSRLHDTVLQVADLVDRPGTSRRVDLGLPAPSDFDVSLARIVEPVRLQGEVASVVEGLLVRGVVRADLQMQCSRCLADVEVAIGVPVAELFTDPDHVADVGDEQEPGYEIHDTAIDLDTMLRDTLVPAVPFQVLCDEACRGLCPTCGINLNGAPGGHRHDVVEDPRWAALEGLRQTLKE